MNPADETFVLVSFKWIVSAAASIAVSVPFAIKLLCFLSAMEVLTCLFNHKAILREHIKRSAISFILTLIVHYVYKMCQDNIGLNVGFDIATLVATYYSLGMGISILKNCAAAGINIPPVLINALSKADGLTYGEKKDLEALKDFKAEVDDASGKVEAKKVDS